MDTQATPYQSFPTLQASSRKKKKEDHFENFLHDLASECVLREAIDHPINDLQPDRGLSNPEPQQRPSNLSQQQNRDARVVQALQRSRQVDARGIIRGPPRPNYNPPANGPIQPPVRIYQYLAQRRRISSLPDVVEDTLLSFHSGRSDANSEPDVTG
ncbi:uncharacterized protein [Amphiura filiformis]|uniref:uncharacterized protein n=1 Tax=Amphiura filiformis TaxID=82378 RepID=UPI003B216F97